MRKCILVAVVLASGTANAGQRYKLRVSRTDSNLYKVEGTGFHIRTKYCYEYAYSQNAVLDWSGKGSFSNKLIFLNYDDEKAGSCDVEALLVETSPE